MSDTKTKRKPGDASIVDYYHKLSPYNVINQNIEQVRGAASDLRRNANDMVADNTYGNDKYFHCKANCEATRRGYTGEFSSSIMSNTIKLISKVILLMLLQKTRRLISMVEIMRTQSIHAVRFVRNTVSAE